MSSRRIAYCIPALYNSGGMERILSVKANYLAQHGYEVHIITTDQMGRPVFFPLEPSIQLHHLDIDYEGSNGGPLYKKLWAYLTNQPRHRRALGRLLQELRPDYTISMFGHEAGFLPALAPGGKKLLEYHFSKLKRLQYERHGLWGLLDRWRTRQDERIVRRYEHFIVLTEEDRQLWGQVDGIQVIPNPKPFESDVVSPLTAPRVIAAGRYCHQKHFDALIRIWASVAPEAPGWQLVIYGDGPERATLTELVAALGLTGSVRLEAPTSDMHSAYLGSSIYAMTSRYEGLPMVLIEAQTMGLPIVAFACPCGPRDIVQEGESGYLTELGDETLFAQRLSTLIRDEALRRRLGAAAREHAATYDLEAIMQQWLALLS